jgi:hypothetical protein
MKIKHLIAFCTTVLLLLPSTTMAKQPRMETVTVGVNQTIGDGKDGRPYSKWTFQPENYPIMNIAITARRTSDSKETYLNLRIKGQQTFEGGKREYLRNTNDTVLTWNTGGKATGNKPIELNAYGGEVYISKATITYAKMNTLPSNSAFQSNTVVQPMLQEQVNNEGNNDSVSSEKCSNTRIRRPRIELGRLKQSGGLFSGKYKINGSIFGACIEEAGYYEEGRRKQEFEVGHSDRAQRTEFSVKVRSGRNGEIRVYTSDGNIERVNVDDEIQRSKSKNSGGRLPF